MTRASVALEEKWTALFTAAERLARARSLDDVVETVRGAARSVTGAEGITFVTCEGDECHYVAEDAIQQLWEGKRFKLSECVSGWVMRHHQPAVIPDVFADDRVPHDLYRSTFVRSMAMMPVEAYSMEAAIGAYWTDVGGPDPQSIDLLAKLARFVGAAINNLDLQNSLEILNRTGAAVAAERDLGKIVQMITDAGVELTGAEFGAFFYNLLDDQGGSYMLYSLSGVPQEAFSRFPMPRNTAVFTPTFAGEGVVRSDNIRLDPRYGHNEPHRGMPDGHLPVTSYLAVPVVSRTGEVHGGLFFGHQKESRFTREHERIVLGIAGHAAIAIDNARLNQRSEREMDARRAAEDGLRESNDRFRAAVDAVQGVLWTNTPEGRMEGEQPGWTALTGQTAEDYAGYGWSDCVHPDDVQGTIEAWEKAVSQRSPFVFEHRLRRADGVWRHYSIRAMPVFGADGRLKQWVGVHTDITEQRIAEGKLRELNATLEQRIEARASEITAAFESLRESERRFRILVEGVSDYAIYMLDPNGIITNWNVGAERIKGYRAEEIIGQHFSHFYTAADREAGKPAYALEMAARTGKFESEGWRCRKDGTEFWASVVLDAVRNDEGELVGFAKITRDLTEKRAVEEQLRQSQKMEAVGQLTGGIAHDFNNLLTIITGNIDMAARWLSDSDGNPRIRRAIDNAMRGAERAASLTQRLLAFSRRQPLSPKPLELDTLVNGMADLLRRSLGEMIRLEIVTRPGLWMVEADPNEIESALINLAVNARDAMPAGGTLTIETDNAHLDATYGIAHNEVPPGNYVVIAVSDTGHGMSKEVLGRVFEPFFTTKEIGRGTGLGLSQVYGFVKQSGGHVNVYSEEGLGTTVKLYLPRFTGAAGEEEDRDSAVNARRSSGDEVILVVEDDEDVRSYSAECLRELGYQVVEAVDGTAALRMLGQPEVRVDLLFTDVVMPGMSGKDLCAAALALRPDLKILYTSGYTRDSIVHGGRLDPGVELLPKPFSFEALGNRVQALLTGGSAKCLLLVDGDANVRLLASEALEMAGFRTDAAANEEEALRKIGTGRSRYHAAIIDGDGTLLPSLRERLPDLPVVVATETERGGAPDLRSRAVGKPYSAQKILAALAELGVTAETARAS